ncbi:putative protein TPRXL [Epinephelus moara]|uniref:putative protein TPRXL n=1 Tax=Epinephelus moara TaxID=300413 RepID=UPI00214F0CFD|nr:putative protein TPRXL [Epinephelus moara]
MPPEDPERHQLPFPLPMGLFGWLQELFADEELSSSSSSEEDDNDDEAVPGPSGVGLHQHGQEDGGEAGPSSSPVFGPEESAPPLYENSDGEYSFEHAGPGMPYSPSSPPFPSDSEMEGDDHESGATSEDNEAPCDCAYCVVEKEEGAPLMECPVEEQEEQEEEESGCASSEPGIPSSICFSAVEDMEVSGSWSPSSSDCFVTAWDSPSPSPSPSSIGSTISTSSTPSTVVCTVGSERPSSGAISSDGSSSD